MAIPEKVTVLTLMSGRWNTWEPYWYSLLGLDWPKESLSLLWYTNGDAMFQKFLTEKAREVQASGWKVEVIVDRGLRPSGNAFSQGGLRTVEHAISIASLYNSAWDHIPKDRRVFSIEDDTAVPSHSLRRFMRILDEDKNACYVSGVVFDRHSPAMFVWEIEEQPKNWTGRDYPLWVSFQPAQTWGVRPVGAAGLGCTLIDPSRMRKVKKPIFKPQIPRNGMDHLIGCDIVFCLEQKGKCLVDYDVRAFHYDSNGRVH